MKTNYLQQFKKYFLPNLKRAVFNAKIKNDKVSLIELQANIYQNWNLTSEEKESVLKELGIWRIRNN